MSKSCKYAPAATHPGPAPRKRDALTLPSRAPSRGGSSWSLLASSFQPDQLGRYASAEVPVAAVVRDRAVVPLSIGGHAHWVGAAEWMDVLPKMRELPLEEPEAAQWSNLLDTMALDGDLERGGRKEFPEIAATLELLGQVSGPLLEHFNKSLCACYGDEAARAVERLKLVRPRGRQGPWAGFGFSTPKDGGWAWFAVRNLWSRAPRLRVEYYPYEDWRAKRMLKEAHEQIERRHGFEHWPGLFRYERPRPDLRDGAVEAFLRAFGEKLDQLVSSRVFDVEIRRQARK